MTKIRPLTWFWALCAALAIAVLSHDAGRNEGGDSLALAGADAVHARVFPELADANLARATIELQGVGDATIKLVPADKGGHNVFSGAELLGAADDEGVEGAWASLRMATALRSVAAGLDLETGSRGVIRISDPGGSMTLELGRAAPEGSGVYARRDLPDAESWVVENELAWLVDHAATDWLRVALSARGPRDAVRLLWSKGPHLVRGEDGLWRMQRDDGTTTLLSSDAVDLRLSRLLRAPVRHFVARDTIAPRTLVPWLSVSLSDGSNLHLTVGGDCPADVRLRILDRGDGGRLTCIDPEHFAAWPLTGPRSAMYETQLFPHRYADVIAVKQSHPRSSMLMRRYGSWQLGEGRVPQTWSNVSEAEVYRWYRELRSIELGPPRARAPRLPPALVSVQWELTTSSGRALEIACGEVDGVFSCARDGGWPAPVVGGQPTVMALDPVTFADRQMLRLAAGTVVGVEIRDGGRGLTVRQSARSELGVWSLDHPHHPDGDGALDETRLEELIAALSGLRAEAWLAEPSEKAQRIIELQVKPAGGGATRVVVGLHDECVVVVNAGRAARIPPADCRTLTQDLLFNDPMRFFLRDAESLTLRGWQDHPEAIRLDRQRGEWQATAAEQLSLSPAGAQALQRDIARWTAWRVESLTPGPPPTPSRANANVRRKSGPRVVVDLGPNWLALAGASWHYRMRDGAGE